MPDADCLFCRIVAGKEPAEIVTSTDTAVVFEDKFPRAPQHLLIAPREHLDSAHELTDRDSALLSECFRLAREVAEQRGIADGYRVATNVGTKGGQAIEHLHFHVIGGRQLGYIDSEG